MSRRASGLPRSRILGNARAGGPREAVPFEIDIDRARLVPSPLAIDQVLERVSHDNRLLAAYRFFKRPGPLQWMTAAEDGEAQRARQETGPAIQ